MSSASRSLGKYTLGEKPKPWLHTFKDSSGTAIDLTGYSVVAVWEVKGQSPAFTPVEITGSLSDAANGVVSIPWGTQAHSPFAAVHNGNAVVGPYTVEIEIWTGDGTNSYSSGKRRFAVLDAVAATTPNV